MSPGMTLFSVQAVLILGTEDGARILTKYYSSPHGAGSGAGQFNHAPTILATMSFSLFVLSAYSLQEYWKLTTDGLEF